MEWLFWILAIIVAIGAAALSFYLKQRRRQGFAAIARQLGLEFFAEDPFGLMGLPFRLFQRGKGRGVENVLWGEWQGIGITLFDYWFYEESADSKGARSRTYHRFQCAVTEVAAACSPLSIERENVLARLADGLGFTDIQFESEEFNRAFTVRAGDRKFANDFVDPRMMRWLLGAGEGFTYEACGKWLLTSCTRLQPIEIVPLLGTAKAFREQVPRVVYALYGTSVAG